MDITRIAELAKIRFSPEELRATEADMTQIIAFMDSLREVTLPEGAADDSHTLCLDALRPDETGESLDAELLLSQSPESGDFRLPRVIE